MEAESEGRLVPPSRQHLDTLFCVQEQHAIFPEIPTIKSHKVSTPKEKVTIMRSAKNLVTKSPMDSFLTVCEELSTDTMKAVKFFKKKIKHQKRETEVTAIHITPEDDESKWGHRTTSSAASRNSTDSTYSSCSTGSRSDGIEVVHDMANENPYLW